MRRGLSMRLRPMPMVLLVVLLTMQTAGVAGAQDTADSSVRPASLTDMKFVESTFPRRDSASDDVGLAVTSSVVVACPNPSDPLPTPRFDDVATGSTHAANIACVGRWGIARGTSASTYAPRQDVTREQMASFVANLIHRVTGTRLPEGRNRFTDLTSAHRANVNGLANAGIVNGIGSGLYGSRDKVTRAQAATILAGAYRFVRGSELPVGPDRFRDDNGNRHEANINRLANVGVIGGLTDREFGPTDSLKRDQMASLLARFLTPIAGPMGTVWYSEFGELRSINMTHPIERPLVYEFGILDTFTVDPARQEFTYIDTTVDLSISENVNQVYVRSTRDTSLRTNFRWGDQCLHNVATYVDPPLASPDGNWFISATRYAIGLPNSLEIRTRNGSCVFAFEEDDFSSWTWMANGDLLVVADVSAMSNVPGDNVLATISRDQLAAGQVTTIEVVKSYTGPNVPSGPSVSNGQDQVAYTYDRDLYVLDIDTGEHHRVARSAADLMWPTFSPDDAHIIVRHRTVPGGGLVPSDGQVHLVGNHRGSATHVRTDGPTMLKIPANSGGGVEHFDAKGSFFWGS